MTSTEIPRDRWGRPMLLLPGSTEREAYTRVTTLVKTIEDTSNLNKWKIRQVMKGLVSRKDLLLSVAAATDKRTLNDLGDQCADAAAISAKANTGTAVHSLTEAVDRGEPIPDFLDEITKAMLEAYREAMKPFKVKEIELFVVNDKLKAAGTLDRLLQVPGVEGFVIGDVKTGNIEYGALAIAAQLATYARSSRYNTKTGARGELRANACRGLIIHLPQVENIEDVSCDLYWVDLEEGWEAASLAGQVHQKRKMTFKKLTAPYAGKPARPSLRLEKLDALRADFHQDDERDAIKKLIDNSPTVAVVHAVYSNHPEHRALWNDELSAYASARVAALSVVEDAA